MISQPSSEDRGVRLDRILGSTDDATAIALKGRLLVGEQLDALLEVLVAAEDPRSPPVRASSFQDRYDRVMAHIALDEWYDPADGDEDTDLVKTTFDDVGSLHRLCERLLRDVEYTTFEDDLREELGCDPDVTGAELAIEVRGHVFYLYWYLSGFTEGYAEEMAADRPRRSAVPIGRHATAGG